MVWKKKIKGKTVTFSWNKYCGDYSYGWLCGKNGAYCWPLFKSPRKKLIEKLFEDEILEVLTRL